MRRYFALAFLLMTACSSSSADSDEVGNSRPAQDAKDDTTDDDDNVGVDDDTTITVDDDIPSSDDDAPLADDDATTPLVEPANHRAEGETCDDTRPPGNVNPEWFDEETAPCLADEECMDGSNGRCVYNGRGTRCSYDTCFSDSDCSQGPCVCERNFDANSCFGGDCQIDADCGEGGYCSPSFGPCGNYDNVVAYWCRTAADTCVEDSECVDPNMGAGYCAYFTEVGYWSCQYAQCVG